MTANPSVQRVVVVGGGIAGGRTCAALRSAGFTGDLVLVGAEQHPPYDRPPLSKSVLTDGADPDLGIDLDALNVQARLGVRATSVNLASKVLETDAGDEPYDVFVVATGSEPILLPGSGEQLTLRTLEDSHRLRERLVPGARVVIVGAGWIGAEVSTAAVRAGCQVTCLEGASAPLAGPLGDEVGSRFLPWWGEVDLRLGVRVDRIDDGAVVLDSGERVPADVVLTGVGVRAKTDWLEKAGLVVEAGGIAVDADRRTSDPAVFAVGDIAARWSDRFGERIHSGHWDEASTGPALVAAAIMGTPRGTDEVPYFWSDQFGRKIQYVGQHSHRDRVVLREHSDPNKWGAAWVDEEGRITAHLSVAFPRAMLQARAAIADRRKITDEDLHDLAGQI